MAETLTSWKDYKETKSKAAVHRQLQSLGYNLGLRTFYRQCDQGLCRPNEFGVFTRKLVTGYIKRAGLVSRGEIIEAQEQESNGEESYEGGISLAVRKEELQVEKLRLSNKAAELEYNRKTGKLIERNALYLELAARVVVLDNGFRQKLDLEAAGIMEKFGINAGRKAEFLAEISLIWDELLDSYSSPQEFEVIFEND